MNMKKSNIKKEQKRNPDRRCPKPCSLVPFKTDLSPRKAIPSFWNLQGQDKICLHLGENPFPPTDHVIFAIVKASRSANRYPDTNASALREKLAAYVGHDVTPDNLIVGNGSDELIDLSVVTFVSPGKMAATFEPSFFVYSFAAKRHGYRVLSIPRDSNFSLPEPNYFFYENREAIKKVSLTFIANPNNPTGTLAPREILIEYLEKLPGVVVVDECYFEFCGETIVDLLGEYENLVIFRSLSKSFGLSGLRIGYAVANEKLIDAMARHALTFPVNVLAQAAGLAALDEVSVYTRRIDELKQRREALRNRLSNLGFEVIPSHTNFLLVLWPSHSNEINPARYLAENDILVSDQTAALGLGKPAIRIAVGTEEENQALLKKVKDMIHSCS